MALDEATVAAVAADLAGVPGVVGVVLGGSRARGDALPDSDVDLGVYYDDGLDPDALAGLAAVWHGGPVDVAGPGGWGPWVDGGAWLQVEGVAVDWILRDLGRVRDQCARAERGEYAFHAQAGHPLGFLDVAYAGELATGVVLADPTGALAATRPTTYPPRLADALVAGVWEAGFLVGAAAKGVARQDATYVLLCLTRALLLCAHGLQARAGRWVTNEKGLVPAVDRLAHAPDSYAVRAADALGSPDLDRAVDEVAELVRETCDLLGV